jgi:hypothetical protein
MDDNFMADIIASGTIATFFEEECSQEDMYLNMPPNEDIAAPVMDTTANIEDNSRNNEESVVNESIECSHEVYIYIEHVYYGWPQNKLFCGRINHRPHLKPVDLSAP